MGLVLPVYGQCNMIDELNLKRGNIGSVPIHRLDRFVAHGLLQIALREELRVHELLKSIGTLESQATQPLMLSFCVKVCKLQS